MRIILKWGITVLAAIFLIQVPAVFAATAYLEVEHPDFRVGDRLEVGLFLDTENEDINAVEGKIVFPEDLLEYTEMRDGDSILNLWLERPTAKNGVILFSGIVPGGYRGKQGRIFSVVFQARQEGQGIIEIRDMKALLNDGQGTAAATKVSNWQFSLSKSVPAAAPAALEPADTAPPEIFEPVVTSDPTVFDGKYFLVVVAQDKGSGIDHYEVSEGEGPFILAASPYLLPNQKLDKPIVVKAVDKSGNLRMVTLPAKEPRDVLWLISILVMIAAAIVAKLLWKKRIKSS